MVQSAKKLKGVAPDPCIYRYHAATVGADGRINVDTDYSKPCRYKELAGDLVSSWSHLENKLKVITIIIFE